MKEIVSLPSSIRAKFDEAHRVATQQTDRHNQLFMREVGLAIAHAQPELCSALIATQLGLSCASVVDEESTTFSVVRAKKVLGVTVFTDRTTTTQTKTASKTGQVF